MCNLRRVLRLLPSAQRPPQAQDAGAAVSAASSGRTHARRLPSRPAHYSGGPWRSLAPQRVELPVLNRPSECDALRLLRRGFAETSRLQQRDRARLNRHWFLLFRLWVRPPTLANNAPPCPQLGPGRTTLPPRGQAVLPCLPRQRQRRVLFRGRVQSVDTLIPRLCRRRLGC